MVDSIKITALQDIGNNIMYTTLVPVVDMSGPPLTKKSTLQNVGNLILGGAGGSYFPRAAQANLALSVANAAQPNITSVGNLTSLVVNGNVTAGNISGGNLVVANFFSGDGGLLSNIAIPTVGNIAILNLDGNASNVLHGDGTWSADVTNYSNSNVANYLPTYTGNVGANWVNATYISGNGHNLTFLPGANVQGTVANATTAGTVTTNAQPNITSVGTLSNLNVSGNVSATYFDGIATNVKVEAVNNSYSYHMAFVTSSGDTTLHMDDDDNLQYNPADGIMTVSRVDMGYLSVNQSVLSNLNPLIDVTQNLGNHTNRWKDIYLSNSTIYLGNAELTSNGNSLVVSSIEVTNGNVGTIGNIASINLDGSNSNVLYGNGVFAPVTGGGGGNLGNLQVTGTTIGIANGASETAIVIGANSSSLTLNTDSGVPVVNLQVQSTDSQYYQEISDYTSGTWVVNGLEGTLTITGYSPAFETFLNDLGQYQSYTITVNGSETTATNGYSYGGGNATFYTLLPPGTDPTTVNNIEFNLVFSNKLLMDPDNGDTGIYVGQFTLDLESQRDVRIRAGDDFSITANDSFQMRANSNFQITTNYNNAQQSWSFDTTGNLLLAGGNGIVKSVPNNSGDGSGLSTLNLYPDSFTSDDRYIIVDPTGPNHIHIRAGGTQDGSNSLLFLGGEQAYVQIDDTVHEVQIGSYDSANTTSYNWRFENDGNLTLPGNTLSINFANNSPAFGNMVQWTTAPVSNTSAGTPGQAAYDSGGNLFVCVATDTWAKFAGTTSW